MRQPNKMSSHGGHAGSAPGGPRHNNQQRRNATPPHRSYSRGSTTSSNPSATNSPRNTRCYNNNTSGNYPFYENPNMPPRRTASGTRLPPGATPSPPMPGYVPPHLRSRMRNDEWKNWKEVKIKIQGLPMNVTTLDIYRLLKEEGDITRIDVENNPNVIGRAWVTFSPPPRRAFWSELWNFPGVDSSLVMGIRQPQQFLKGSSINPSRKYPENMTLSVESVEFGIMYSESAMMSMRKASSQGQFGVSLTLDLRRPEIRIEFPLEMFNEKDNLSVVVPYRFTVTLQRLRDIFEEEHGDRHAMIIPLDGPPHFFRKIEDAESTHGKDSIWTDRKLWYRQTDITHFRGALKTAPTALRKKNAVIDIGRWTTYRLEFNTSKVDMANYHQICDALTDFNVNIIRDTPITILPMEPTIMWDIIDASVSSPRNAASPFGLLRKPVPLKFEVRYQLEVCLSNNILNEHNITCDFVERLAQMDTNMAKTILEVATDKKRRFYDPMDIFQLPLGKKAVPKEVPTHYVYSRAATITPSNIILASPAMEISNRVIRDHLKFSDRFLRVKFTEEKPKGRLGSTEDDSDNQILTRVWRTIRNGIAIGGRHYEFLAFGNSQFREHGAYFFAPVEDDPIEENNVTPSDIRGFMGEFHDIHEVARYASRMGQCFSTTREVTSVKVKVTGKEDVTRNGYNFTDGVGKISPDLARHVAAELGHPNAVEDPPSLFQFRLGGCKGVLAVSPELISNDIHVRRSQDKFPAPHDGLEIIKWSQFATATLNRQLIIVLDGLGVPATVFMNKLRVQLSDLTKAMTSEYVALRLLQRSVDFNQVTLTLASMILDGFMSVKEPFLMSVLHLWRTWSIKYLKEKAKLFVGDGAFLLGCVDETASLHGHFYSEQNEEDQDLNTKILPEIFVKVSDVDHPGRYKIVEGVCIVARNPSLHPGDIRVVRAVNKEELHHLKNVVVFPQTGDCDIPNMCSGGDLDGDDYMVIWDKELIPQIINYHPMDFTPSDKNIVDEVTMEDIARFFVEYIKNDSLGKIANAHLAFADYEDEGVMSKNCLGLARIHSTAVDYPKSGIPAKMEKDLRPRKYPHFMQSEYRPKEKTYISRKILGQLYDAVEEVGFDPQYAAPFDSRILNAYILEPAVLNRAKVLKELYDAAIRRLMAQHNIDTEFEVWSSFILKHNNEIRDYQLQEDFGRIWEAMREQFQKLCFEEAAGGFDEGLHGSDNMGARAALQETGRTFKTLGPFIAAMYTVTAQEMQAAVERSRQTRIIAGRTVPLQKMTPETMPLMSFPWIFSRELGLIATGAETQPEEFTIHPQIQKRRPAAKKTRPANAAQDGWTKEDELFVDGGLVKHGELIDPFGDISKTKGQNASDATGKDTLRDVSNMPTEPTQSVETSLSRVIRELDSLKLSSTETTPEKEMASEFKQKKLGLQEKVFQGNFPTTSRTAEGSEDMGDPDGPNKTQKLHSTRPTDARIANVGLAHFADAGPPPEEGHDTDYLRFALADTTAKSTDELVFHSPPPSIASTPALEEQDRPALPIPAPAYYSREGTPASYSPSNIDEDDDDVPLVAAESLSEVETRRILGRGRVPLRSSSIRTPLAIVKEVEPEDENEKLKKNGKGMSTGEETSDDEANQVVLPKKKGKTTWDRLKRFA